MLDSKVDRIYKGTSIKTIPECFPDNYCVIDIETTGINILSDDIIEIAAIKVSDDKIISEFSSLVCLDTKLTVPKAATIINGITTDMLKNAPKLENVLLDFLGFIGEDILIFHSQSHFDVNMIYDKALKYDIILNNNFVDNYYLANHIISNINSCSLESLSKYFNLDYSNAHRALTDCYILNNVYINIKNYTYNNSITQINKSKKSLNNIPKTTPLNNDFINFTLKIGKDNPFADKKCVISGTFSQFTDNDRMFVLDNLGINKKGRSNVSGVTDFLIVGQNAGPSKLKKAEELNVTIVTEQEFYLMLDYTNNYIADKPEIIEIKPDKVEHELKKFGFTTRDRKRNLKPLYYKGIYSNGKTTECQLIGKIKTNDYTTFVIKVDENYYNISPSYLKEMQYSNFTQNSEKGDV